ncbi:MAG: helix-turn-helix transcriptional regulator [Cyclobacteriaceae bacterium]|nr:helix-turn-helix transcriptional regulator [Cyclobacteriaceae bacterium]
MQIELFPSNRKDLSQLIETYYCVRSPEPIDASTVPNGRPDGSILLEGQLEWYFPDKGTFELLPPCTLYPATTNGGRARTDGPTVCLAIKFFPKLFTLNGLNTAMIKGPIGFQDIFSSQERVDKLLRDLKAQTSHDAHAVILDDYFIECLLTADTDAWLTEVFRLVEKDDTAPLKIESIADHLGINIKTLERKFKKATGLSPKEFISFTQLQKTLHEIIKEPAVHGKFTASLGAGYHDQSHFIKTCQRITGHTPKKLMSQLVSKKSDLLIHPKTKS